MSAFCCGELSDSILLSIGFSVFKDDSQLQPLSCRTEKDRGERLNHRTAGINTLASAISTRVFYAGGGGGINFVGQHSLGCRLYINNMSS